MTDRKRDQDCPLRLAQERQIDPLADVLRDRTPPEARLGPYPADDLVETPAPRPSLAPFGSPSVEEKKHRAAPSAATDYVELHARSAFSFLHGASLPEDLAAAAAEAGHAVFGLADVGGVYGAPRFHTAVRNAAAQAALRHAHLHPAQDHARCGGPRALPERRAPRPPGRRGRGAVSRSARRGPQHPRGGGALRLHARGPGVRIPRSAARVLDHAGRGAVAPHPGRCPRALRRAWERALAQGRCTDRAGAFPDREARA